LRARVDQPLASVLTVVVEPVALQSYDRLLAVSEEVAA
jgi:hypothetical protein